MGGGQQSLGNKARGILGKLNFIPVEAPRALLILVVSSTRGRHSADTQSSCNLSPCASFAGCYLFPIVVVLACPLFACLRLRLALIPLECVASRPRVTGVTTLYPGNIVSSPAPDRGRLGDRANVGLYFSRFLSHWLLRPSIRSTRRNVSATFRKTGLRRSTALVPREAKLIRPVPRVARRSLDHGECPPFSAAIRSRQTS
jgi:hypothetical protein